MSVADPSSQGDVLNAEHDHQRQSTTPAPLSLMDMPVEIIQEIADFLLCKLGNISGTDLDTFPYTLLQRPEGRDVLALASCSRRMRSILLARRLLAYIAIHPCERDLDIINGWDESTLAHVQ
jgi:hypothetical protein